MDRVRGSERCERAVKIIHKKGFIDRELTITDSGQKAYRYFNIRTCDLIKKVKKETSRRVRGIGKRERKIRKYREDIFRSHLGNLEKIYPFE